MRKGKILTGCLAILLLVSGCSGGTSSEPTDEPKITVSAAPSVEPAKTSLPDEESSQQKTYQKEEKARLSGLEMELLSVEEQAPASNDRLSAGKKYVLCKFRMENKSEKDITVNSQKSFEGFSDGMAVLTDNGRSLDDVVMLDGILKPGGVLEGYVVFKLPEIWRNIEITYIPGEPGKKIIFCYTK